MDDSNELQRVLRRIDGRSYKAYRELRDGYDFGDLSVFIDHVQGDPFAAPSRLRVRVPMAQARLPQALREGPVRSVALRDCLARGFAAAIRGRTEARRGSGKSGEIRIDAGGQEVLERSAVLLDADWVEARVEVGLPGAGRRVLGREAERLLLETLPELARAALFWDALEQTEVESFVACVEAQESIRARLPELGLIAFVGNGSILPRESGASDRPMRGDGVVAFESPPSLAVEIELPTPIAIAGTRRTRVRGMGIGPGVTLLVGGGYHGKSTLLRAIERSVYPHVPGDGREWVVADPGLVKIRAEDGRSVRGVDIHSFIREVPGAASRVGRSTECFSSDDASGSTSQAANIAEALEAGARGLLLDEDTSATNFMVRDARMQALVRSEHEPITPFVERIRELHERLGVSSVLVMGGCGDYFDVADRVVLLQEYVARDASDEARRIAEDTPSARSREARAPLTHPTARIPLAGGFDASSGRREVKISAKQRDLILYGREAIELRGLEQLVDTSQTRAIAYAIYRMAEGLGREDRTLADWLTLFEHELDDHGLDPLAPFHRSGHHPGNLARPRRFELAAAINRMRSLRIRPVGAQS